MDTAAIKHRLQIMRPSSKLKRNKTDDNEKESQLPRRIRKAVRKIIPEFKSPSEELPSHGLIDKGFDMVRRNSRTY